MLCFYNFTQAQTEIDALRYSQLTFGGTARYMAMGGAFGALGADFSTLSTNPAGIGLYKKSEFTFSPSFYKGNTTSTFGNSEASDSKYNLNISNVGFVFVFPLSTNAEKAGWKNVQFGFGLNRLANFNNRMYIDGFNSKSSLLTPFLDYADGINPDDLYVFDTKLAYETSLIFDTISDGEYHYNSDMPNGGVQQTKSITTNGSINELVVSVGGNFDNKLYFGATLGFPQLRYFEQSKYTESDINDLNPYFESFDYHQDLETKGNGYNLKAGIIYRPFDFLRLGAAVHTPTFYNWMKDNWSASMTSRFDNAQGYKKNSPEGEFEYTLETPMRLMGSIAFIIGDYGLISGDYEYLDYSEAKLRSDDGDFFDANDAINNCYTDQNNIRLGTEWRLGNMSLRGGYAWYGSPYANNINDYERRSMSFGIGFREKTYFVDFAYVRTESNEDYYLYDKIYFTEPVKNEINNNNFIMTMGFKF
jgi:hypothetical protein